MPRFFFHVSDGVDQPDTEGTVLPDTAAARRQAAVLLGRLMIDAPEKVWEGDDWTVNVMDETALHLFAVHVVTVQTAAVAGPR